MSMTETKKMYAVQITYIIILKCYWAYTYLHEFSFLHQLNHSILLSYTYSEDIVELYENKMHAKCHDNGKAVLMWHLIYTETNPES